MSCDIKWIQTTFHVSVVLIVTTLIPTIHCCRLTLYDGIPVISLSCYLWINFGYVGTFPIPSYSLIHRSTWIITDSWTRKQFGTIQSHTGPAVVYVSRNSFHLTSHLPVHLFVVRFDMTKSIITTADHYLHFPNMFFFLALILEEIRWLISFLTLVNVLVAWPWSWTEFKPFAYLRRQIRSFYCL